MTEGTGYKHDASDRKLDQAAEAAKDASAASESADASGPGHDEAQIRQHDDTGKDRLFEGREQRDDAERLSERNRRDKDVAEHDHGEATTGAEAGNATPDRIG